MKKAINQSLLTLILNLGSILMLLIIAALSTVVVVFASSTSSAQNDRYALINAAEQFLNGSETLTNEVRAYAATGNQEHYDNYYKELETDKNRDIGKATMASIGLSDEEQQLLDSMTSLSDSLVPLEEAAMQNVSAGRLDEAINYVYGDEYSSSTEQIHSLRDQFLTAIEERTTARINTMETARIVLEIILFAFIACTVGAQILSLVMIRKRVIAPIKKIEQEMEEIASGDLASHVALEPDTSEIGRLIEALLNTKQILTEYISDISQNLSSMAKGDMAIDINLEYIGDFKPIKESLVQIVQSMNSTLSQLEQAAKEVTNGSEQIAGGAQALAQGSTQQASSVQELASTIVDISSQIRETASQAQDASQQVESAGQELNNSNQYMNQMMEAMDQINATSSEIGKIVKTIEDIAFQTNILALNAAVEAARAGEAGKGFAVVADEVRNLAGKSAEAAQSTTQLIEDCLHAIENGTTIANTTAESLNSANDMAHRAVEIVNQISERANQQAEDMLQATEGVNQISDVISTNSATAQESAAASEELSSQANLLKHLVNNFHLRHEE